MADAFESNPSRDQDAIYVGDRATNQYHGVRDVDIAKRVGRELGLDVEAIERRSLNRSDMVRRIKEELEEG